MILAAIDTSTRFAGVGVMDNADRRATRAWRSDQNHGRELLPNLVESLAELSLAPTDVTHVAVALGPGGFSAVRVGISAALGLAVARKLPTMGIPTHSIEFYPFRGLVSSTSPVYSVIPAGRGELSWARHVGAGHEFDLAFETGVSSPDELAHRLEPGALLCGEACDLLVGLVDESRFVTASSGEARLPHRRDPDTVLDISVAGFRAGAATTFGTLRPIYARPPSISRPKPAK